MSELDSYLKRRYGISEEEYESLLSLQGGVCKVCRRVNRLRHDGTRERLAVDHNHQSGANRALLRQRCNRVLGMVEDSQELLLRLLFYLRERRRDLGLTPWAGL